MKRDRVGSTSLIQTSPFFQLNKEFNAKERKKEFLDKLDYFESTSQTGRTELPFANSQLPTALYCLPTANGQRPTARSQLLSTVCQQPTANWRLRTFNLLIGNWQLLGGGDTGAVDWPLATGNDQLATANCQSVWSKRIILF